MSRPTATRSLSEPLVHSQPIPTSRLNLRHMDGVLSHLTALLGSTDVRADKGTAAEWTRTAKDIAARKITHTDEEEETWSRSDPWEGSVLSLYLASKPSTSTQKHNASLSAIYQKADSSHLVQSLQSILTSNRTDDEISGELVELLGYDELDNVIGIINDRASVIEQLRDRLSSTSVATSSNAPAHFKGNGSAVPDVFNARQRMQQQFEANAARPLFTGVAQQEEEALPHVYTSSKLSQNNVVSQYGSKYMLPLGTTRQMNELYEEVIIPPANPVPPKTTERQIPVAELDEIAKGSFPGYTSLNRIQSIVYPTAYGSNENMLICAPTGAGKTDVAMLTILRVIDQHRRSNRASGGHVKDTIDRDAFKIIYVAPMKALASEIVRKLGKRLAWLAIEVRELTGDMQMTKAEIAKTQIIVTTPEKWDVVTRKPTGEGELASSLKLLIIDEVHLLNEERGAVIETIVARTLRQVESSQSMIRIVGLSATLPNYKDVAEFLCASHQKGLFYFDSSFRPVPLEQHFLGIKGKSGSLQSRKNMDDVTFEKVSELVAAGHQVMVFVHARKETVKTALGLKEKSVMEGNTEHFSCEDHPQWSFFRQKIGESRNKEMKQLFDNGFGIHHAGMLRSDRNMMERMFEARAIKVLCCTATLAWGVNLPAHAVIIKGTQVYDSAKGKFVDLSVLDVLQIFGRAGRPGLESSGEGYICTTDDKLTHYLDAVTSQIPIESQFQAGLMDSLNAEIALGTVANARDAVQWLGYTYMFVRMRMNPFVYGIPHETLLEDSQLGGKRNELIQIAAKKLAESRMISYDSQQGQFQITDIGRIAARYYIRHASIEIFNKEFRPKMSEADVLAMLSMSTEFDQIQVREPEVKELEAMMERIPCQVKGVTDTSQGKVNILLQGYISREMVEDFALVSDMAYVAQNAGRIVRALLEIAISKKWANVTLVLMSLSKAIESRLWPFDHPLRQFNLKAETLYSLEKWADEWTVAQLAEFSAANLGALVHLNEAHGSAILNAAKRFPTAQIAYTLRPIAHDVLKISLQVNRGFEWNTSLHGTSEPFWLWVEDHAAHHILQFAHILFHQNTETLEVDFFISIPDGDIPPFVTVRAISDRWVGADDAVNVPFDSLVMPAAPKPHTPVLNLPFLKMVDLQPPILQDIFSRRVHTLNTLQTQTFWNLVHTRRNSLLCGPVGSGKTTLLQMAIWSTIIKAHDGWVLIVTPNRVAALEMVTELRQGSQMAEILLEYDGNNDKIFSPPRSRTIRIASAEQLLQVFSKRMPESSIRNLHLVVCDGLERLDATYELAVALLRLTQQTYPTRFTGASASLNDATDLAQWLGVHELGLHSFRPQDRDQSLAISRQTFTIPYSASLFKAMAKPAFLAIQNSPKGSPAIVFVPSRGQCRPIAQDLITRCTLELETGRGFIPEEISDDLVGDYCARLGDTSLLDYVLKGVGFFHSAIPKPDRLLMLEMFAEGIIRVLVVPKDACWTLPARASVVVVMGTQYAHVEGQGSLRQIRDYTLTEVARMQSRAILQSGTGYFHLFCQAEALETYSRFLDDGLPLESQLAESQVLFNWMKSVYSSFSDKQRLVDALSFTFLAQRIARNPSYYGFVDSDRSRNLSSIVDRIVDEIYKERKEQRKDEE